MATDVTPVQLNILIDILRHMPGTVSRQLGKELLQAAQHTVGVARRNASWSSRIPGEITARMSRSHIRPGAMLVVGTKNAPHARVYEWGDGRRTGTFRHPVFGDREVWVSQKTRPYLSPAIAATRDYYLQAAEAAVNRALRAHGFTEGDAK